jgi:5-methylthioadenosine/S-adenosylhomocysteine deaminase
MRQAALLAKGVSGLATAVPAYQALEMATINGAKSLGLDEHIGSLEVGKQADFVAVDMSALETQPLFDVTSQLVYAAGRQHVTDVWVAGKHLLKQRQLSTMNESQIHANAVDWASKIGQATS